MFEQLIASSEATAFCRRPFSFLLAFVLHAMAVGGLILVTPLFPETLSNQLHTLPTLFAPPPLPPGIQRADLKKNSVTVITTKTLTIPDSVPKATEIVVDSTQFPNDDSQGSGGGVIGGVTTGSMDGILDKILGDISNGLPVSLPAPPVEPPPPALTIVQHIVVGGDIQKANLIYQVKPSYPPLAKQARIQGPVLLAAVIAPDGGIEDLRVVSGHPLLISAAVDAVKQWRYSPTRLNGQPTWVDTTITVSFSLNN
jgi:protein TonB